MDKFEEMRIFSRVVEAGSITRAAETTHIAKSAISRRLSELESRLNVQLITRTTRKMTLTDAGRTFYDQCQRLLADLESVESEIKQSESALKGRIRLSAPSSFGILHLAPVVTEFSEKHPQVFFDIDFNDRQVDLIEEGFDLAIRISKLSDSGLIARRLAPANGLVLASPNYWDTHGRPKNPADLANHRCLEFAYRPHSGWRWRNRRGNSGVVNIPPTMTANNGHFIREAAIAGQGVILQPTFICSEAVDAGILEPVLTNYSWMDLTIYAVYPNTRHLTNRIRAFIDFLAEQWGDDPYWDQCCAC